MTWKMRVRGKDKFVRDLYFCRIREQDGYRYFGPSGSPDMPSYSAHQFYREQVSVRYHKPARFDITALRELVRLANLQGDSTRVTYTVPNIKTKS